MFTFGLSDVHSGQRLVVTVMNSSHESSLRILLVDDNADHLFLARRELEGALNCEVITAWTGAEALRLALTTEAHLDAILLDNGLLDMTGLDVLTQLREADVLTPIIIITGQGSEQIAVEALRRGASDYIVKSAAGNEIFPTVVQRAIERDYLRRRTDQLETEHVRFARMAAIGEVAAGIAHEIRNPMTIISGMATLIRDNFDKLPPEELRQCVHTIADNCMRLNHVLDEVLSSSSGSGQRTPMLLSELVDETLSFMRFDRAFRYRMEIERDFQKHGLVIANRDELKQVFINLFRNAAQAIQIAGKNNGTLRVVIDESPEEVIARVEDDGPGIAPEAFEHLFEAGFTTKSNASGEAQGSGLGLGICRRIIENHGGRLWAEKPQPGQGAVFCVALPRAEAE
jgi:signal transduction histidine kinase